MASRLLISISSLRDDLRAEEELIESGTRPWMLCNVIDTYITSSLWLDEMFDIALHSALNNHY